METIVLEIGDKDNSTEVKYFRAISMLQKALHFKPIKVSVKEESPIPAVRERIKRIEDAIDARIYAVFKVIVTKWVGVQVLSKASNDHLPFKLNGTIVLNPKTGKALTKAEWRVIEKEIRKLVNWAFGDTELAIARQAIALGKVLATMPLETNLDFVPYKVTPTNDAYLSNAVAFAEENAAAYITAVSSTLRKDIKTTIIEAQKNRWGARQLESALFDKFSSRNRDFRMIAETEFNSNANSGYLLTILQNKQGNVFVKGKSNANACKFCRVYINDQIFVLLPEAPLDGVETRLVDGQNYKAVWPGKNNVGRKLKNWWAAVPAHPHCACFYVETKVDAKYQKYYARLNEKMEGYKRGAK